MFAYFNRPWNGHYDLVAITTIICSAIALWNAGELLILIILTFRKWSGLNFWSLLIATTGIVPYTITFLTRYFEVGDCMASDIINNLGWIAMVGMHSVVLYSRLHLVNPQPQVLRALRWMIAINTFVLYTATTIAHFGQYTLKPGFFDAAFIIEKIQMTCFTAQELFISGLYMKQIPHLLSLFTQEQSRRTLWELFFIMLIIVILDLALLVTESIGFTIFQVAFKSLVYSAKLKMEFAILGKLVALFRGPRFSSATTIGSAGRPLNRQPSRPLRPSIYETYYRSPVTSPSPVSTQDSFSPRTCQRPQGEAGKF